MVRNALWKHARSGSCIRDSFPHRGPLLIDNDVILMSMMVSLTESSAPVRLLLAIIAALVVVLALLYLGLTLLSNGSKTSSGGVSFAEQEKLDVLAALKSPDTVPATQKAETLQALGSDSGMSVSEQQKLDVLHSLQKQ